MPAGLSRNLRLLDPARWHLHRCALGSEAGSVTINVNEFSPSSSVLAMTEHHWLAFPGTRHSRPLRADLSTLDAMEGELHLHGEVFLKVDVQGYELEVLKGAARVLQRVSYILVETSFVTLYAGQPLHETVDHFLNPIWIQLPRSLQYRRGLKKWSGTSDGRALRTRSTSLRILLLNANRAGLGPTFVPITSDESWRSVDTTRC